MGAATQQQNHRMQRMLKSILALWRDRRGAVALLFGLLAMPFVIAAGLGVDLGRIASARTQVQAIADQAALAGASAYADANSSGIATSAATEYLTTGLSTLPIWITVN